MHRNLINPNAGTEWDFFFYELHVVDDEIIDSGLARTSPYTEVSDDYIFIYEDTLRKEEIYETEGIEYLEHITLKRRKRSRWRIAWLERYFHSKVL